MKRWWVRLAILAACLLALGWTVAWLGPRKVAAAARGADPTWLALSAAAVVCRYLVWAYKWRRMLARRGDVSYGVALRTLMAGVFVNLTTPTAKLAGGFVRAALIHRRHGWGLAASYGWSLADQFTNSLGNVMLGGVLLLLSAPGLPPGALRGAWIALGVMALAGPTTMVALRGAAWRRAQRPAPSRWLARLTPSRWRVETADGPKAGWLIPVVEPLLGIGSTWRVAPHDLGLAAMSCACLCVSNAFALEAVGAGAPPFQAAAALVMAGFVGTVAGTVGGIGATELALIGFLGRMDVPPEAAAAGALLHRSAYYAVSLGLGGIALLLEGKPADAERP